MTYTHRQTKVKYIDGTMVKVDHGIADLLQMIWQCDIETEMSCQNNTHQSIWIQFKRSEYDKIISHAFKYYEHHCIKQKRMIPTLYEFLRQNCIVTSGCFDYGELIEDD